MAFNGSGLFQRLYNWVTDRDNGVRIIAQKVDDEMDGMAVGLSNCITKDGQTIVTQNIPMSSKKFTGLADGSDDADSATVGQVRSIVAGVAGLQGGYLTLITGTPVMSSNVTGATTVYLTRCALPLWNATLSLFVVTDMGGELSQLTTDTTKSPGAVANNSNYDMFAWDDSGTKRCTRGPAWSSDGLRGSGAGSTELEFLGYGLYVNKYAIANGPTARMGTYVGSIMSNGTATIDWKRGSSASGGGEAVLGVWNNFNRRLRRARVTDSAAGYTYTSATIRPANNSTTNRVTYISGLQEDAATVMRAGTVQTAAAAFAAAYVGYALDATAVMDQRMLTYAPTAAAEVSVGTLPGTIDPQLGKHIVQMTEVSDGTNANTFSVSTLDFAFMM